MFYFIIIFIIIIIIIIIITILGETRASVLSLVMSRPFIQGQRCSLSTVSPLSSRSWCVWVQHRSAEPLQGSRAADVLCNSMKFM